MIVLFGLAWGACPQPAHTGELAAKLAAAESAYGTLDVDTFANSLDEAAIILPCVAEPIEPALAATWLRMQGLRYFIERDAAKADLAFAAARTVDSVYDFPLNLVPTGHSLRAHYTALDPTTLTRSEVPHPKAGELRFNGLADVWRSDAAPAIVQVISEEGAVLATAYVQAGQPLPPYEAIALPKASAGRSLSPKVPLGAAAGVAAAASVVLYVMAAEGASDFEAYRADDDVDALDARRARVNGLTAGAIGAGILALAGGAGVVFVGEW